MNIYSNIFKETYFEMYKRIPLFLQYRRLILAG